MSDTVRILFGTETGNAEDCAADMGAALSGKGFRTVVTDMDEFEPTDLPNEAFVVVLTSTFGNGDPPVNAEALMEWLQLEDSVIAGLDFAVCGLGDSTYPRFAQAGKDFDRLLEERGAQRVLERKDCDVDFEEPIEEFTTALVGWLEQQGARFQDEADSADSEPAPASTRMESSDASPTPSEASRKGFLGSLTSAVKGWLGTADTAQGVGSDDAREVRGTRSAPVVATMARRVRLNQTGSAKETMHYEFIWNDVDVAFQPGDSFAVVPENDPVEVAQVLTQLGLEPSASVSGQASNLAAVLQTSKDLQAVSLDLLDTIQTSAGSQAAGSSDDPRAYLADRHLVDVLREHEGCTLSAEALVEGLKRLKPRLYSVANSPLVGGNEVHFTVETLRYTREAREVKGVASTWLCDRLEDGARVSMYCVPGGHFRLPTASDVPVIMIGPGTGVAPFRAFLQHRQAQGDMGKNWLFFGHQHEATDFLYADEIGAWQAAGVLSELSLAWSRDQEEKVYVQHRLVERGGEVWSWLRDGAHVYVCGDRAGMAPQVRAAVLTIAQTHGDLSLEEAQAFLAEMESSNRYCEDVY